MTCISRPVVPDNQVRDRYCASQQKLTLKTFFKGKSGDYRANVCYDIEMLDILHRDSPLFWL